MNVRFDHHFFPSILSLYFLSLDRKDKGQKGQISKTKINDKKDKKGQNKRSIRQVINAKFLRTQEWKIFLQGQKGQNRTKLTVHSMGDC
jgi:hypothetical protein